MYLRYHQKIKFKFPVKIGNKEFTEKDATP